MFISSSRFGNQAAAFTILVADSNNMLKRALLAISAVSMMLLSSCGYSRAGKAVKIPANVRTIAVPAFVNQTQTFALEQSITAATVREFISRTKYHVTHDVGDDDDAVLKGTITSAQLSPLTYDANTGRASSGLVTVNLKVTLTDRQGKVLYEDPNYIFRETYQITREISSFFREESPALDRLSHDVARTLVTSILENY
jgi:lipopolysaccharide assembly LptE-like protein